MFNRSKIFKDAWNKAKRIAKKYAHSSVEYISSTLKEAWYLAKKTVETVEETCERLYDEICKIHDNKIEKNIIPWDVEIEDIEVDLSW